MKKLVIIIAVLLVISFMSCDFLITPQRGRENPNDPLCPVGNFSVIPTGSNSVEISFRKPGTFDEMGNPDAVWIFYRQNQEPASLEDSYDDGNAPDAAWLWWSDVQDRSEGDIFTDEVYNLENIDQASTYYFGAYWTYDDNVGEKDPDAEWFGPVTDTAVFQTTTMTLNPTIDGYVSDGGGSGFAGIEMYFGYSYNYISLLKFDSSSLPSSITEATLNLVYRWGSQDAGYEVYLIGQDWDDSTDYTTASDGDFTVADSNNPVYPSFPSGRDDGDSVFVDVTGLIDIWQNYDQGYGFKISSPDLSQTAVYTTEYSDAYAPSLVLTYYPED